MGKQDHYAAAFGGLNQFIFQDDDTVSVKPINLKDLQSMNSSLLLFWCGKSRPSESVLAEQNDNIDSRISILNIMKNQVFTITDLLLNFNISSLEQIGTTINEGWKLKKN